MHGRIAVPVHNLDGALVGYLGRDPEGKQPDKFPDNFRPDWEFYNAHRALAFQKDEHTQELLVVPDAYDGWRLHEAGYGNAAALFGDKPSVQQIMMLRFILGERGAFPRF